MSKATPLADDEASMDIDFVPDGPVALTPEDLTLYSRMGGETKILQMTKAFFEEIGKRSELGHFFENVPVAAIQLHQGKFFKVLFGPDEEKPTSDELLDYMIATHVRLFRDKGLNASHFDIVAECFVKALQAGEFTKDQIDEILAIVGPLRVAFDYGSKVAETEKRMSEDKKMRLPPASMDTMRMREPAVLPPGVIPPAEWLVENLGSREDVRKWTCALTYRFTVADKSLQEVFMAVPYLDMEPYLHNLMQIAFQDACPVAMHMREARNMNMAMRFPLGIIQPKVQVNKALFQRMMDHFEEVGKDLLVDDVPKLETALKRLKAYRSSFPGHEPGHKIGSKTAHRLKRDVTDRTCTDSTLVMSFSTMTTSASKMDITASPKKSERKPRQRNPIFAWIMSRRQAIRNRGSIAAGSN